MSVLWVHMHANTFIHTRTHKHTYTHTHLSPSPLLVQFSHSVVSRYLQPHGLQHREGNGTPLQYSCLENPMDGGAWWAAAHGVAKSWTRLSDFTFTFHFHALEEEMETHSSVLAWRIPGTAEPGGLPSMGSHSVGHDWSDLAAAAAARLQHARLPCSSPALRACSNSCPLSQ